MLITVKSLSDRLFIFISFSSFSLILSCYSIWSIFLCFLTLLCVYFYDLGGKTASSKYKRMALCMVVSCVFLITLAGSAVTSMDWGSQGSLC